MSQYYATCGTKHASTQIILIMYKLKLCLRFLFHHDSEIRNLHEISFLDLSHIPECAAYLICGHATYMRTLRSDVIRLFVLPVEISACLLGF